jgi:hypothetical protein
MRPPRTSKSLKFLFYPLNSSKELMNQKFLGNFQIIKVFILPFKFFKRAYESEVPWELPNH